MKFEGGSLICMIQVRWTGSISTQWGNVYYNSSKITLGNWPVAFKNIPWASVSSSGGGMAIPGYPSGMSTTSAGQLEIYRPVSASNATFVFDIIAYGKWK